MGNESCAVSGWSVRFHVPGINPQARRKMEGTSFTNILRIPPKRVKPISPYETGRPRPTPEHYRHSGFPFRHPRLLPSVIPAFSPPSSSPSPLPSSPPFPPFCHPRLLPFRHPRLLPPLSSSPSPLPSSPPSPPSVILAFSPSVIPAFSPSVIPAFSPSVIPAFSPSVILAFSPLCHPRLLPPLSSSTLVIEDPGFFACIPAPSHGATSGRPWFWVLLPKQKDRVVRGRNPARTSPPSVIPDLIRDPGPCLCFQL